MTHTYKITGMTCGNCGAKVKSSLLMVPGVTQADVSKDAQSATISMEKHIPLASLQKALPEKYQISAMEHNETTEQARSWLATYKPILLLFGYISTVALTAGLQHNGFHTMQAMNVFMAGFFLSFSFFKLLNLNGFADSYAMYDIVARKFRAWGFLYPFAELLLGLAYATGFQPLLTNSITLLIMTVSIIAVLQSVLNKQKIRCACLGVVFNLPMSTVTIIEDALMIVMSAIMIYLVF
jgi:copper chaperone CopZ